MLFFSLIIIIRSPVMHFSQIWPPSPILGAIFGFGYVLGHFGGQICRFWFWLNFSNFFQLFCNEIVKLGTFFNNLALLFECWFGYFHFKTTKNVLHCQCSEDLLPSWSSRRTSTVSRLQTWWWSILQIFVSILVNVLVNVQRLQVCNFILWSWSILP